MLTTGMLFRSASCLFALLAIASVAPGCSSSSHAATGDDSNITEVPQTSVKNQSIGNETKLAVFLGGRLMQFLPGDPKLCAGLNYQRFPEIETMIP